MPSSLRRKLVKYSRQKLPGAKFLCVDVMIGFWYLKKVQQDTDLSLNNKTIMNHEQICYEKEEQQDKNI